MAFDKVTELRLQGLNKELSNSIRGGELPFLGDYSNFLYDNLLKAIHEELSRNRDPLWLFFGAMVRWPAVFATYLTHAVAEGYGERGTAEVYRFVENAIHTSLTHTEKEKLWSTFRNACIKLGLSVSPRRSGNLYMVEEYLRQAGVPLRYAGELAEKMYAYANEVGVPDDDDPEAIRIWKAGLKSRTRYLAQPVQKALAADDEGFYARMFVRLFEQRSTHDEHVSDIEKIFSQRIHDLRNHDSKSGRKSKSLAIPQFVFRDGQLGVELPEGEDMRWRIEVDGQSETHVGILEKRFIPFSSFLPQKVSVTHEQGNTQVSKEFWPDDKNNRFLVFSAAGGLICKGQLGQSDSILLEPGEYDLLLRFFPSEREEQCEQLCDDPQLVLFHLTLDPAQSFELFRGPAKALFKADTKPSLTWNGQKFRGILGNELYASTGLYLDIKIPEELFAEGSADYELRIDPGGLGEEVVISLPRQEMTTIDMQSYLEKWSAGVSRLLVELRRQGFQRSEVRSAVFCWNGLQKVSNRTKFICSQLPAEDNLLQAESDNLRVELESKTVAFRNDDQRVFRMVFLLPGGRRQLFTWAVPGVFMQILNFQEGQAVEKPLKKGSTLSVTTRSREVLEIFSSSNGVIELGTLRKHIDFDRLGRARLPVAGLVEYIGPGADRLRFTDSLTQVSDDLLRLVSPHHILEFKSSHKSDSCILSFSTKNEVEELTLKFKDLITGWEKDFEVSCNSPVIQGEGGFSVWLTCLPSDQVSVCSHELQFFLENWPNGAWFVTLQGKINGRWGRFSNARNDHFAFGLIVVSNQTYRTADLTWEYIKELDPAEQEKVLKRIHRRLQNCYAPEAWTELEWLEILWQKLTQHLADETKLSPMLISLSEERNEGAAATSWVPQNSLATKFQLLYSQRGGEYRELPNPRQLLSVKCLQVLGRMKYGVRSLLNEGILNNMLAFSFENPAEIVAGRPPRGFNLQRFEAVLKMEDVSDRLRLLRQHEWQPGEGDYLGSLHYRFATEQLTANFMASMSGNEYRRGKALSLCRNMASMPLTGVPSDFLSGSPVLDLSDRIYDEEYTEPVEVDLLRGMVKFLSMYARACRWEVRTPGCLEGIWNRARTHLGSQKDFELVLGYLLALGKDVFLYYLLLWEAAFKADVDSQEGVLYVRQ